MGVVIKYGSVDIYLHPTVGEMDTISTMLSVGWATRCPPMFYTIDACGLEGHKEMVGNELPTLR